MNTTKIDYALQIMWSPEDNAYVAWPYELPGCIADGPTPEEALANVRVVISEWIEVALEEGRPVPEPMSVIDYARITESARQQMREHIDNEVKNLVARVFEQFSQAQSGNENPYRQRGINERFFGPVMSIR